MNFIPFLESKFFYKILENTFISVKKRLHTMIRSKSTPDDLLDKLIPTKSLSMNHAIDRMNRPLGVMLEKMYSLVQILTSEIRETIEAKISEIKLYRGESLDLMLEQGSA